MGIVFADVPGVSANKALLCFYFRMGLMVDAIVSGFLVD